MWLIRQAHRLEQNLIRDWSPDQNRRVFLLAFSYSPRYACSADISDTDLELCNMPAKANKQKVSKAKTSKVVQDPVPLPQWPSLEPLVPYVDLSLDVLLRDQIVIIRNFFTSTLCRKYVSFLANQPLITTPSTPKAGDTVRVNDRVQFDDYAFAKYLWEATGLYRLLSEFEHSDEQVTPACRPGQVWGGDLCGLNPRIRVYRYSEGQFFGQHCE